MSLWRPKPGHGLRHSAALGEAVAQSMVQGQSTISLGAFGSGPFAPAQAA
jgi:hypothetical protein